jgi:glycosyltransferase involved in cell wall biosynthesis
MEKISCKLATDIIAVSYGVMTVLKADRITNKKVNVIWNGSVNGLDADFFDPKIEFTSDFEHLYEINDNHYVFGYAGRLVTDKGINELVGAFKDINKLYPYTKLLLVGNIEHELDPLFAETIKEIQINDNIILTGFQKDIRPFYKMMDLFVFPSYREGFGISLMEAAAMNLPAISSNIIGCNEIIIDNINGFLIPSKSKESVFNKMKYCLDNRKEVKKMAIITREIIISKFEQKELWKKTIEVYKKASIKV